MVSFKTFLEAGVTPLSAEQTKASKELAALIKKNCSNSLWMFENKSPIWRGDKRADAVLGNNGAAIIDTDKSSRQSENTSNWYTTIFDNHPEYADYPKRSKSLICSTRWRTASNYTGRSKDDYTMALVPYNNCKIGWVGKSDIWSVKVQLDPNDSSVSESVIGMNYFLNQFEEDGLNENDWNSFQRFSNEVKKSPQLQKLVKNTLDEFFTYSGDSKMPDAWAADFFAMIKHAYSPKITKMEVLSTSDLKGRQSAFGWKENEAGSSEMWVGDGKVIALHHQTFMELRKWIV